MANYMSSPVDYGKTIDSSATDLLGKVATLKQQKYDANFALVQSTIDQYGNIDLARPEDREYLAGRLQKITDVVNNSGNRDLSRNNVTRSIQSQVKTVLDDYVVTQIGETKKIRTFENEVANIKEKKRDIYSDTNYTDALEQGGFDKYMKGEVNTIGNLSYKEYVDINGKLSKKAKEYSELMGKKQLLDSQNKGYYVENTFGERVYMQDIYATLDSELDEKDKEQLRINARQSIGKLDKTTYDNYLSSSLNQEVSTNKLELARLEAKMQSVKKEERAQYADQITALKSNIKDTEDKVKNKTFSEGDMYRVFNKSTLANISSNYDFNRITDIETDTTQLEIAKFQQDVAQDEISNAYKQEELRLKGLEVKAIETQAYGGATVTEKPQEKSDEKSAYKVIQEGVVQTNKALDTYLRDTNENGYNQKSTQEQWQYKLTRKADDIEIEGNTKQVQDLFRNFQNSQSQYATVSTKNKEYLKENIGVAFDSFKGANLDNLSSTMPYTASLKKKGYKFSDLDEDSKAGVIVEMGANASEFISLDDNSREVWNKAVESYNLGLGTKKSEKAQRIKQAVDSSFRNRMGEAPTMSSEEQRLLLESGVRAPRLRNVSTRGFSFNEDANIDEIESYSGDASIDFSSHFKNTASKMLENTISNSQASLPNLRYNKAFSFSTDIEDQKDKAERLKQVIQSADETKIPNSENNYTISREGGGYKISFDIGSGKDKTRDFVVVDKLSEDLQRAVDVTENSWANSVKNPNAKLPTYTTTPKQQSQVIEDLENIVKNRPDLVPTDFLYNNMNAGNNNLKGTPFSTPEGYIERMQETYGKDGFDIAQAQSIANATFKTTYAIENERLITSIYMYKQGQKDPLKFIYNIPNADIDTGVLQIDNLNKINAIKLAQLDKTVK